MTIKKSPTKRRIKKSAVPVEDSSPSKPLDYCAYTDQGNAERFLSTHGSHFRYDHTQKQWFVWAKGKHSWQSAFYALPFRAAAQLVTERRKAAQGAGQEALAKWLHDSEQGRHIDLMIERATYGKPVSVEYEHNDSPWNRDPWLLAVQNGVIDLRTGKIRKGAPSDMINQSSPIVFDPAATCPVFDRSVPEWFCGDEALAHYVLKAFGYAATGMTGERCVFVFRGEGSNGKSKLLEIMQYVFGVASGYTSTVSANTLRKDERGNPDAPRNDLASIAGSRLVVAHESDLSEGMAESVVKWITGGDLITCRYNYGRSFQYRPPYKVFISCNRGPNITGTDDAIWNRLPIVEFKATFRGEGPNTKPGAQEENMKLDEQLRAEAPGILNRVIQYCQLWQREGLVQPDCVKLASAEHRVTSNPVAAYLDLYTDHLPVPVADDCKDGSTPTKVWESYAEYMRKLKEKPLNPADFKACMVSLGYGQGHDKKHRWWKGVTLLDGDFDVDLDG